MSPDSRWTLQAGQLLNTECSTGQDYAGSVKSLLWVEHQAGSKQKPFEHGCGLGVGERSQGPWLALELEERCARTEADSRRISWEVEFLGGRNRP